MADIEALDRLSGIVALVACHFSPFQNDQLEAMELEPPLAFGTHSRDMDRWLVYLSRADRVEVIGIDNDARQEMVHVASAADRMEVVANL